MEKTILRNQVISHRDIEKNLVHIFSDAIITDTQFRIVDMSKPLLRLLDYRKEEIVGKPLSVILADPLMDLICLLNEGYFVHTEFILKDRSGAPIEVFLSGYYLGLISEINGRIIINVKSRRNTLGEKKKLEKRLSELAEIIYRTSHDICGPLATIKGLVLTAQYEKDAGKAYDYLAKINRVTDKLDLVLQYLRESISMKSYQFNNIPFESFEKQIHDRTVRLGEAYELNIGLHPSPQDAENVFYTNPFLVSILLENVLLIIDSLKITSSGRFDVRVYTEGEEIKVMIQNEHMRALRDQYALKGFSLGEVKFLMGRNEFNYLNFKLIRICKEILKARIAFNEDASPALLISIPSRKGSRS